MSTKSDLFMRKLLALACAFSLGIAQVQADSISVSPAGISPNVVNTFTANQNFNGNIDMSGGTGNLVLRSAGILNWATRSGITSPVDSQLLVTNAAGTGFSRLQLGGITASFPAIKVSGAGIDFRLADDSAFANIGAQNVTANANLNYAASGSVTALGRSRIMSPADGNTLLTNNAQTDFNLLQFGGTSVGYPAFKRSAQGLVMRSADDTTFADFTADEHIAAPTTGTFEWLGGSIITSPTDGIITLTNNASSNFSRLTLGPATASFPAVKANGPALEARLADDSAYAALNAGNVSVGQIITSGKILSTTGQPIVSICGTGASRVGTDVAGTVTQGTTSSGCTLTFSAAFTNPPVCTVTSRAGLGFTYTTSTTALTITNVGALSSTALDYICMGY